jgi:hypothetical protein
MTDLKSGTASEPAEISFTLTVDAMLDGGKVSKISFSMDLNPDERILEIGEYLSSRPGLAAVFEDINRVLAEIEKRTGIYNSMIRFEPAKGFNPEYEENIRPSFGKIDSINYRHESPGEASVTYARRYNGDLQPPSI